MRDEFLIMRQGKQYVLFAGLLDEAHNRGLRGIDTELIQVPTPENGNVAVVKAVVNMEATEGSRTFSGIGDASPDNVGRNIAPHIIRMAETRAKARALRDAVNVGATALEELSDGDDSGGFSELFDLIRNYAKRDRAHQEKALRLITVAYEGPPEIEGMPDVRQTVDDILGRFDYVFPVR